ncbi:MAG: glycerophosphodiester phosphodiesterase [Firmicutes bacterium]|nr:glycerophosphodiester phosphodiesterase [Bacillota bacterium]
MNASILAWMITDRYQGLRQEEDSIRAAADIAEAAAAASDSARRAQGKAEKALIKAQAAEHICPHRGSSGESLEHSFTAYDEAIRDGAVMIEQDIVISAEGTLYVSHDLSPYRMCGVDRAFSDMTDAQIDQLRTYAGEKVLRLSDVFDRYRDSVQYVVELKSADQRTIDAFIALVEQYGNQQRVTAECFEQEVLRILEERFPDMPKLFLCRTQAAIDQGCELPYADIISVREDLMTEANARRVHDSGKGFSAWPMYNEDEIRRAIDLDTDIYFADDVKLAFTLEEEYGYQKRNEK